jgi:hypothetical protein
MLKVLQICGRAPAAALVPPDIPGAERWIVGSTYHEHVGTAYTRVFDVHPVETADHHKGILALRPDAWRWYGAQDRPVYLIEAHPDVPASVPYPRARLNAFGVRGACALSSSVDHMLALALLEGFTEIHLCGVRMISVEEWVTQRECLAYWIGRADAMGVEVITDPVAALCAPERVYGFGDPTGARRAPGTPVLVYGMPGAA